MATQRLPAIVRSPTTFQYHNSRYERNTRLFFKPRFSLTKETREKTLAQPWLYQPDPLMPPYPYGRDKRFIEANNGLYGGATIQSGNKISDGRNKGKTLRKWYPNVRVEKIRSEALDTELTIPITARVMRTINKCGGLDEYVTGSTPARIKELGLLGWHLRWHVMNSDKYKTKYSEERARLGLSQTSPLEETFADVWNDPARRQELIDEQKSAWAELREKSLKFEKHVQEKWAPVDKKSYASLKMNTLSLHDPSELPLPTVIEEERPDKKFMAARRPPRPMKASSSVGESKSIATNDSGIEAYVATLPQQV